MANLDFDIALHARKSPSIIGFVAAAICFIPACSGTDSSGSLQPGQGGNGNGGSATGGASVATGGSGTTQATGGSNATGGANGQGGAAATGGAATGGSKAVGGAATGGAATGGAAARGGASSGGQADLGGSANGGALTGGKANAGGAVTGGSATGGAATAGAGKGGAATGGAASTGGTVSAGGASATGGGVNSTCGSGTSTSSDIVINLSSAQQKISGFGASTAWAGTTMSATDADTLWSTTTGAGLSLHRIRIDTTGTNTSGGELGNAKLAVARGVTVWATPWTPPAADKDNSNTVMGHLSNGQDFANKLKTFVSNMKNQGVNIYAVSAQNEPDANVTYESCVYTGDTIAAFIANYMGPALTGTVKVMAPETQNWCGFNTFWPLIKANATAMGFIDIIATHEYGCSVKAYPDVAQAGKEFWETEIYDTNSTVDDGMGSALRVTKLIHDAMTVANMNAWHYWWVFTGGNGGLYNTDSKVWTKRLWIMGNYSRFVRPGFQRVSTSGTIPSNVWLSAYHNQIDGTVAIVAANNNTSATNVSLFITGAAPCSMTPWVTSSSDSLASKSAVSVSNSRFTFSLGAQSVTTFVGRP